jgi:hypothetical protein
MVMALVENVCTVFRYVSLISSSIWNVNAVKPGCKVTFTAFPWENRISWSCSSYRMISICPACKGVYAFSYDPNNNIFAYNVDPDYAAPI